MITRLSLFCLFLTISSTLSCAVYSGLLNDYWLASQRTLSTEQQPVQPKTVSNEEKLTQTIRDTHYTEALTTLLTINEKNPTTPITSETALPKKYQKRKIKTFGDLATKSIEWADLERCTRCQGFFFETVIRQADDTHPIKKACLEATASWHAAQSLSKALIAKSATQPTPGHPAK